MTEPDAQAVALLGAASLESETHTTLSSLYDRHGEALYRYALALTGSADDAEDAVQEVFARLVRRPRSLARLDDARAYLFTGVRNAAYSVLRGRRRRGSLEVTLSQDLDAASAADICTRVVDATLLRETFALLPLEQREVLALKVFEGMTFKEIAATTRTSQNTVASRYRYAIEKLRRALEESDNG